MRTLKGPAIFLAQFMADDEPFNSIDAMAQWASQLGFVGLQVPIGNPAFIDVAVAAEYPGWPITIAQRDNFGKEAVAYLPELIVEGTDRPIVQIVEEKTGKILYTLRIGGTRFQPWVFAPGSYTVRVARTSLVPASNQKILTGLTPSPDIDQPPIRIDF